jgi:hypothetical protein
LGNWGGVRAWEPPAHHPFLLFIDMLPIDNTKNEKKSLLAMITTQKAA